MTAIPNAALASTTMKTVMRRIVPLVLGLYVVAYLDRVSLSYAQLRMGKDLGLDPATFGLAASMFFVAYLVFEIPSNSILYKVGSRVWLARIGITWGIITVLTSFVQNETQLIIARLLLGAAEAGLVPGVMFYMTRFFPTAYKARAVGLFFVAGTLSGIIAGPVAGVILDHVQWGGAASWRWVFALFGIPAVLMGIVIAFVLRNEVKDVKWLTAEQRTWLIDTIDAEHKKTDELNAGAHGHSAGKVLAAVRDVRTMTLFGFQFLGNFGAMGLVFFTPLIIQGLTKDGASATTIGLLSALPYVCATIGLILNGRHSDRKGERAWHTAIPVFVAAIGLVALYLLSSNPVLGMIALCVATVGAWAHAGPAYSLAQQQFVGRQAAIGIAVVSSGAALSGLVAPLIYGLITKATGSTTGGSLFLAAMLVIAGVLVVATRKQWITADGRKNLDEVTGPPPVTAGETS
jgi:MFS transporter, ACS family, tartrate transporter